MRSAKTRNERKIWDYIPVIILENRNMANKPITLGIDHVGPTVRELCLTREVFVSCLGWQQVGGSLIIQPPSSPTDTSS